MLSIVCFVAMLGVLIPVNQRAIASWPPSIISPNALISLLSTIGKSALLLPITEGLSQLKWLSVQNRTAKLEHLDVYDLASRGPFGALQLLWNFRLRSFLAVWGAVLIVIALAIDPFAQLLLHVDTKWTLSHNETALMPASTTYNFDSPQKKDMPRDTVMRGTIISTMYGVSSTLAHTCSTGNCTWSMFSTLAVCSRCRNVTEQTNSHCVMKVPSQHGSIPIIEYGCNYTLPGGANFTKEVSSNISVRSVSDPRPALDVSAKNLFGLDPSIVGFTNISTLRFADGDNEYRDYDATECYLYWCQRTYHNTTSYNGIVHYDSITESELLPQDPNNFTTFVPATALNGRRPSDSAPHQTLYTLNNLGWSDIANLLTGIFTQQNISGDNFVTSSTPTADAITGNSIELDFIKLVAASPNATSQIVDALATAMSNQIRRGTGSGPIAGLAWRNEAFYYVYWQFYVFHAAFALLGLIFAAVAIGRSQRKKVPAWKSSSLALLVARLQGWEAGEVNVVRTPRDLKIVASQMRGGVFDEMKPLVFEKAVD